MSPRDESKAATRAKVEEASRKLFEQLGYEPVTMRDIAQSAGVSTGALFSSFTGKAELFAKVIGRPAPTPEYVAGFLENIRLGQVFPADITDLRNDLIGRDL